VKPVDLTEYTGLTFSKTDAQRFPALGLACRAMNDGESMPAVMNAANEVAVELFLTGRIGFTDIPVLIERTMDAHNPHLLGSIDDVLAVDAWARVKALELLERQ